MACLRGSSGAFHNNRVNYHITAGSAERPQDDCGHRTRGGVHHRCHGSPRGRPCTIAPDQMNLLSCMISRWWEWNGKQPAPCSPKMPQMIRYDRRL